MLKSIDNSNVVVTNPQNLTNTLTNTTVYSQHVLRRGQPELLLQNNFAFEHRLWEDDIRASVKPVVSRDVTGMHLSPVEVTARQLLVNEAIGSQKLFIFNLVDAVESLESSSHLLLLEEVGLPQFSVVTHTQETALLTEGLSSNLHGIAISDLLSLVSTKGKALLFAQLLRIHYLLLSNNVQQAQFLLRKLKLSLTLSNSEYSATSPEANSYLNILRSKVAEDIFAGTLSTRNFNILRFVSSRMFGYSSNSSFVKQYIWKREIGAFSRHAQTNNLQQGYFYSQHRLSGRRSSLSFLYFLRRLNEKITSLSGMNLPAAERLVAIRNYLLILSEERLHRQRQKNLVLTRPSWLRVIRRRAWRTLLVESLLRRAERTLEGRTMVSQLHQAISPYLLRVNRTSAETGIEAQVVGESIPSINNWRRTLRAPQRLPLINKKLVEEHADYSLNGYSNLFSQLTGRETSLFFINALSLTRFAFQSEGKGKSSQRFLQNIDREMVSRYKYVAVYIQDFVRVSFISLFLKKPTFLAQFMALQISKLPRNRKETKMLRFLIKVVKIFAAQRREVVGLRVLFKGRVNRWRRTKQVIGEKGILPLQSLESRIEFGFAKAITRKGTLGIRIWICYNPVFQRELRNAVVDYFDYSQQLRQRSLNRFLANFQTR